MDAPPMTLESQDAQPARSHAAHGSADDKAAALLQDRFGPKVRPLAYVCHLPRIASKAREFGYAIAVHGSLQRDLDLVAVPWSEEATDSEQLVQAICETAGAFILQGQDGTKKPHGRISYVLQMGAGLYIDLSVMPRLGAASCKEPKEKGPPCPECGGKNTMADETALICFDCDKYYVPDPPNEKGKP